MKAYCFEVALAFTTLVIRNTDFNYPISVFSVVKSKLIKEHSPQLLWRLMEIENAFYMGIYTAGL